MDENVVNFLRFLSVTSYALLQEQVAQGLFQRTWSRLIPEERQAVVNQAISQIGNLLTILTPETVGRVMQQAVATQERPMGFQAQGASPQAQPAAPGQSPTPPIQPPRIPGQTSGSQQT